MLKRSISGVPGSPKVGFIVKPIPILRLSAALHIPTYYHIEEEYYSSMDSEFDNGDNYYAYPTNTDGSPIDIGVYEYQLTTPLRLMGGMAVQIGKMGLIAADVEYLDYSNIRYRNNDDL